MTKQAIIDALRTWINQRPGLEYGNYGNITSYRSELRSITRDLHHARELLRAVELRDSISAEDLARAFRAYSGRMTLTGNNGTAQLSYCTGQYWPTEYRKVVCAIAAAALWEHVRFKCMPAPVYRLSDGVTFKTQKEASEYAEEMRREQNCILAIEEKYDGVSAGDWIRRQFRREYGRSIASRWFN